MDQRREVSRIDRRARRSPAVSAVAVLSPATVKGVVAGALRYVHQDRDGDVFAAVRDA